MDNERYKKAYDAFLREMEERVPGITHPVLWNDCKYTLGKGDAPRLRAACGAALLFFIEKCLNKNHAAPRKNAFFYTHYGSLEKIQIQPTRAKYAFFYTYRKESRVEIHFGEYYVVYEYEQPIFSWMDGLTTFKHLLCELVAFKITAQMTHDDDDDKITLDDEFFFLFQHLLHHESSVCDSNCDVCKLFFRNAVSLNKRYAQLAIAKQTHSFRRFICNYNMHLRDGKQIRSPIHK